MGRGGFVALGASGSLVNVVLAALGLALLTRFRRGENPPATGLSMGARHFSGDSWTGASQLFAWLLFAINSSLVGVYMTVSPLADFGDWATVIHRFEPQVPFRLLAAAVGAGLTVWATRTAARTLGHLVDHLAMETDGTKTQRLVRVCWLSGGALAVAAALFSPLGLGWALFIAVGSTLGCTWPMMVAARMATEGGKETTRDGATRQPAGSAPSLLIPAHRGWIAAGLLVGVVFVFVFGPGIHF
jgi:hypothetical protein